jgi:hypothetical protein
MSKDNDYQYWHDHYRLSVYRLILWWFADRLDHVNGFPMLHDGFVDVPHSLRIHLLNATSNIQAMLYSMVPYPHHVNAEWTSAQMELRNGDLVISLQGNNTNVKRI